MASHRIATVSRSSLTRSSLSHSCNYRPATEAILLAPNRLYHATGARFQNGGNRQQLRRTEKPSGMAARRGLHSTRAAGALPNDSQGRVQSDMSFPDNIPESQETAANTAFEKLFALKNQTILITGGGRGLGIALARGVIQAGGHAACMDILPSPAESEWSDLQALAKKSGLTVSYHSCDISKEADMRAAIGEISERGRSLKAPLKGAIACAGIQQKIPILEYPVEDFERMFRVNTTGAFITAKVVANDMVQNNEHGSIVMIASMSGTIANRGLMCSAYNSSKAAVHQMGRSMAQEVGVKGIRVNTLSPGYIRTKMTDELLAVDPDLERLWMAGAMLGRLGAPEDFIAPAIFLLSPGSSFMTGSDLRVDGGHTASA